MWSLCTLFRAGRDWAARCTVNLCALTANRFPGKLRACHTLDLESINGIIFVHTQKNLFIYQLVNSLRKRRTQIDPSYINSVSQSLSAYHIRTCQAQERCSAYKDTNSYFLKQQLDLYLRLHFLLIYNSAL